jgi:protein-S-isoprenylcysteine O-methyltransferase Ste14
MSTETPSNVGGSAKLRPGVRVALILVGGLLYYSLAVLGEGGLEPFLSHPPLVALAITAALVTAVSFFAGGNLSPGVREDRGNRWVLTAFGVIGVLGGWLPAYTDRHDFWTIDGDATRWLGVLLFVLGAVVRIWPVFVLGHRFSGLVAIQPGHTLVTTGIYRFIRHPSYLGLLLNSLGWALAFRAGAGVLLTALTLIPLLARIRAEERLLRSQFGDDYEAFCARTWRLIPGVY